jgi:hypothetical protein
VRPTRGFFSESSLIRPDPLLPGQNKITRLPRQMCTRVKVYPVVADLCVAKGTALAQDPVTYEQGKQNAVPYSPIGCIEIICKWKDERHMNHIVIDQDSGVIILAGKSIESETNFHDFEKKFSHEICLIYGKDGARQYGLKDRVKMFDEDFGIYFTFKNNKVRSCTLELTSGIALEMLDEYPNYPELQRQIEYLHSMYEKNFHGDFSTKYEWERSWGYTWGRIVLAQEAHSSRVITEVSWA